jgi:hypothetical protein
MSMAQLRLLLDVNIFSLLCSFNGRNKLYTRATGTCILLYIKIL